VSASQPIVPEVHPAIPATAAAAPNAATVQQVTTQFNVAVPSSAWTPEVLQNYHNRLTEAIMSGNQVTLDNNARINVQRWRDFAMGILLLLISAGIIVAGIWLYLLGKDLGKDLVIATVSVGLGFFAGYGSAYIKRQ
jgi:hypothetical protein